MASNTVLASNFSTSKLSFTPLKILDNGGKQAYLNYGEKTFVMQTPSCVLPYGMSVFDKAGPVKYSIELSLRGYEEANSKMAQFYNALRQLDDYMIEQGVKNSKTWFKSDLNKEVVKAFYTPVVRVALDKDGNPKPYPPTIKISLKQRRDTGKFETAMYDENKIEYTGIPMEELLVKGAQVTALIQCTGIWFAGGKYGLSWKATQIRVNVLPASARGFTFVDDDEDEAASSKKAVAGPKKPVAAVMDEEEEEEEEEDEAFTAKPAPTKASVLSAVLPKPAPAAPVEDEEAEDVEPVPVPKKTVASIKKKVVPTKK